MISRAIFEAYKGIHVAPLWIYAIIKRPNTEKRLNVIGNKIITAAIKASNNQPIEDSIKPIIVAIVVARSVAEAEYFYKNNEKLEAIPANQLEIKNMMPAPKVKLNGEKPRLGEFLKESVDTLYLYYVVVWDPEDTEEEQDLLYVVAHNSEEGLALVKADYNRKISINRVFKMGVANSDIAPGVYSGNISQDRINELFTLFPGVETNPDVYTVGKKYSNEEDWRDEVVKYRSKKNRKAAGNILDSLEESINNEFVWARDPDDIPNWTHCAIKDHEESRGMGLYNEFEPGTPLQSIADNYIQDNFMHDEEPHNIRFCIIIRAENVRTYWVARVGAASNWKAKRI